MINYNIIGNSISYYEQKGFKRIESPWTVTKATSDITRPVGAAEFTISEKNKVLVASGEQSFLYLYNKDFLPKGKFQTVTPCFRNDVFDSLHTKYFIKNELIITDDTSKKQLQYIINCARDFFRIYCLQPKLNDSYLMNIGEKDDVLIVETGNGGGTIVDEVDIKSPYLYPSYDLIYRGVELGSYGIRSCDYLTWIYGTGVAEPRLTRTLNKYGVS
jgi:hypothetical protein